MSVQTLLSDIESKISSEIGSTGLSNPSENSTDPLVQIILSAVYGLDLLDKKLSENIVFDIDSLDCAALESHANSIGDGFRMNSPSKTQIFAAGVNGSIIPMNTAFTDDLGTNWLLEQSILISNGFGFGTASSPNGEYLVSDGELSIASPLDGINIATNGSQLSIGYITESCEQLRARLSLGNNSSIDTENDVINQLNKVSEKAWLVSDYDDCLGGTGLGIAVIGGDDTEIAEVISKYTPFNYIKLIGNTEVTIGECQSVRFIRPCPIGVQIKYWSDCDIEDSEFISSICLNRNLSLDSFLGKINNLKNIEFKLIRQTASSLDCGNPTEATGCDGSIVSLVSDDCPCSTSVCPDDEYLSFIEMDNWSYPVFLSASRVV